MIKISNRFILSLGVFSVTQGMCTPEAIKEDITAAILEPAQELMGMGEAQNTDFSQRLTLLINNKDLDKNIRGINAQEKQKLEDYIRRKHSIAQSLAGFLAQYINKIQKYNNDLNRPEHLRKSNQDKKNFSLDELNRINNKNDLLKFLGLDLNSVIDDNTISESVVKKIEEINASQNTQPTKEALIKALLDLNQQILYASDIYGTF